MLIKVKLGIQHQVSCLYTSQHNGWIEWRNRQAAINLCPSIIGLTHPLQIFIWSVFFLPLHLHETEVSFWKLHHMFPTYTNLQAIAVPVFHSFDPKISINYNKQPRDFKFVNEQSEHTLLLILETWFYILPNIEDLILLLHIIIPF